MELAARDDVYGGVSYAVSDRQGHFALQVPAGRYDVTAVLSDFDGVVVAGVTSPVREPLAIRMKSSWQCECGFQSITGPMGVAEVQIQDWTTAGVPLAAVKATRSDGWVAAQWSADIHGALILNAPEGRYVIEATALGLGAAISRPFQITSGQPAHVRVTMAKGAAAEGRQDVSLGCWCTTLIAWPVRRRLEAGTPRARTAPQRTAMGRDRCAPVLVPPL